MLAPPPSLSLSLFACLAVFLLPVPLLYACHFTVNAANHHGSLHNSSMQSVPSHDAEPFHVFHKVPVGDGPYVKAKHIQLVEKNPDKAISLFRAAVEAGDRVDSALKDMAIVMKQQGRCEEAIHAVLSLRSRCSEQAQESLDNVLLDLYKSCGKLDEQITLLIQKLDRFHKGLAFNGKRTKTARSQGRKFQVSLEQEAARLLGNLGWAYMQQQNFIAAEAVYRRALAMEADNNKVCNLGVCLMKQGKLEDARAVLMSVKPVLQQSQLPKPGINNCGDSHMKSYERAKQLLLELRLIMQKRCTSPSPSSSPLQQTLPSWETWSCWKVWQPPPVSSSAFVPGTIKDIGFQTSTTPTAMPPCATSNPSIRHELHAGQKEQIGEMAAAAASMLASCGTESERENLATTRRSLQADDSACYMASCNQYTSVDAGSLNASRTDHHPSIILPFSSSQQRYRLGVSVDPGMTADHHPSLTVSDSQQLRPDIDVGSLYATMTDQVTLLTPSSLFSQHQYRSGSLPPPSSSNMATFNRRRLPVFQDLTVLGSATPLQA